MRVAFCVATPLFLLTACGGSLKVRYDLLDPQYVRLSMLEQRVPDQIRIVRGVCQSARSGPTCADVEKAEAEESVRQANAVVQYHWAAVSKLACSSRKECRPAIALDAKVLSPQFQALNGTSVQLAAALKEKVLRPFDSASRADVPPAVRELALARAAAVDALAASLKQVVGEYERVSTQEAIDTLSSLKSAIEVEAKSASNELERASVLDQYAKAVASVEVSTPSVREDQATVSAASATVADGVKDLTDKIRDVSPTVTSSGAASAELNKSAVARNAGVNSSAARQQEKNDTLLKKLNDFLATFAIKQPQELITAPGELSGFRLDRATEAFVVTHAPDVYWSEKYQKAYGKGWLGNVNVAVRYSPADSSAEGSVGSFNIKGLTFDPSQVAQMASKAVTQGLLMYTQMATGRMPTASPPAAGTPPASAPAASLSTEVGNAKKTLALYDAQMTDRRDAMRQLYELTLELAPSGTTGDAMERREAADSVKRWFDANKDRLAPTLGGVGTSTPVAPPKAGAE